MFGSGGLLREIKLSARPVGKSFRCQVSDQKVLPNAAGESAAPPGEAEIRNRFSRAEQQVY